MNKRYILIAKFFRFGKSKKDEQFFSGTLEQAHDAAQTLHEFLVNDGCHSVRVEIWEVIATSYQGTVRR